MNCFISIHYDDTINYKLSFASKSFNFFSIQLLFFETDLVTILVELNECIG